LVFLGAISNQAGFAETARFALPQDLSLRGASVYAQGFAADPQGPEQGHARGKVVIAP